MLAGLHAVGVNHLIYKENSMKKSIFSRRFLTVLVLMVLILLSYTSFAIAKDKTDHTAQQISDVQAQIKQSSSTSSYVEEIEPARIPPERGGPAYAYYSVAGVFFHPYASTESYYNDEHGCLRPQGATMGDYQAPLNLPNKSELAVIYVNYKNWSTSPFSDLWLVRYHYSGTTTRLAHITLRTGASTGEGYFSDWSFYIETGKIIDNLTYTYSLVWESGSSLQELCGVNVGYIPPSIFGTALPLIQN